MIKPLTSLRFFFALLVFFMHVSFCFPAAINASWYLQIENHFFKEGFVGVGFFFTLSGFILSYSYEKKILNSDISYKDFLVARIARIYPLHIVTMLLAAPLMLSDFLHNKILWLVKLVCNLLLVQSFISYEHVYSSFNMVSWSLSDEMFFYALFPILIFFVSRNAKNKYVLISLLILVPVIVFLLGDHRPWYNFYINPFLRVTDFILGILLYKLSKQAKAISFAKASILEIAAIGLLITFFSINAYIPEVYRYSCFYWLPIAVIIFIFSMSKGWLSNILSSKYLVLLGEISFAFYLLHDLVLRGVKIASKRFYQFDSVVLIIISLVLTIALSYFFHKRVELPMNIYIKKRWANRKKVQVS
ncbi:MAG: acyltransferase [Filimonas sp.]|nr:acyltransferase [Filimonas sp.]